MPWYLLVLISAFFLGIYSIIEKKGLKEADPVSYLFLSWLVITALTLPLAFFVDITNISAPILALLLIKSFSAALFFILIGKALEKMEISEFAPFLSFSPMIVLLLSFVFLGERVGLINFLGMLLIITGAYVLELKDGLLSPFKAIKESKYIHFILLGLVFAGFCAVLDRAILKNDIEFLVFYFYNNIFLFLFMSLFALLRKNGLKTIRRSYRKVILLVVAGVGFYMIGDIAYFKALAVPAALVALVIPLKRTSILVSTILGGEIFHEKNILKKTIATIIMLAGVFLIVL